MKTMYLATFGRNSRSTVEKVYVDGTEELPYGMFVSNFKYCETEREAWEYIQNHAQVAYDNAKFESDSKLDELNKIQEILNNLK
jgi:hypothetical protein